MSVDRQAAESLTVHAPSSPDETYGPDRTLIQMAAWLTERIPLLDALFEARSDLRSVRICEELTQQHPLAEGEMTTPMVRYEFLLEGGKTVGSLESRAARELAIAVGPAGEGIRIRCVMTDETFFHETFDLTIQRDGSATARIGYWNPEIILSEGEFTEDELLEQYFLWQRRQDKYVGCKIELRLLNSHILKLPMKSEHYFQPLVDRPSSVYTYRDIVPYAEEGFRALFAMQRDPNRVEFTDRGIVVAFDGQIQDLSQSSTLVARELPCPAIDLALAQSEARSDIAWEANPGLGDRYALHFDMEGRQDIAPPPALTSAVSQSAPTLLRLRPPHKFIPDIARLSSRSLELVSERFRTLVELVEPGVHGFYPVKVLDRDGKETARTYFLLKIMNIVDARRDATAMLSPRERDEWLKSINRRFESGLLFDGAAVTGKHLWRDKQRPTSSEFYVSDLLWNLIDQSRLRHLPVRSVRLIPDRA
jgi:hypothetical protein